MQDDEISLLDLFHIVADNIYLIAFGSLGAGILALGMSFLIPPIYSAKVQFLPPQQQQSSASALIQSLGSMGGLAAAAGGIKNPADQYIAFLKTQSILDDMVNEFNLQERYKSEYREDARKELINNTKFQTGKESIISIEVEDKDPIVAAEMANGYVVQLKKLMSKLSLNEAQQRREFFENKVIETKIELEKSDKLLRATGIKETVIKSSPAAAIEIVAKIRGSITSQEVKINGMKGYLSINSPDMKQALLELNVLKSQLKIAEKNEIKIDYGKIEDSYVERYRDYKYKEALYELFSKQYELARVDESREGSVIQVIDPAKIPERKIKPKRGIIAIVITILTLLSIITYKLLEKKKKKVLKAK